MKTEPLALIRTVTHATLAVTCLALCLPYALHGEWLWALVALWLCAIIVPVPSLPPWGRALGNVSFAGAVILAASAAARLGHTMWALIAVAAATATWDLQHLIHRLRPFEPATPEPAPTSELAEPAPPTADLSDRGRLVRSHLQRLATTLGISLALGSVALVVRADYSIRTLAILTLILAVGLGGAVAYLRRASD